MLTMTETRHQLQGIDQKIIALFADRVLLCAEARERNEGLDLKDVREDMLAEWIEEAAEYDIPEDAIAKIGAIVMNQLCRGEE
ncbi:MAG: chorismate mutase [Candidatus Peribacteraceae bacterium]